MDDEQRIDEVYRLLWNAAQRAQNPQVTKNPVNAEAPVAQANPYLNEDTERIMSPDLEVIEGGVDKQVAHVRLELNPILHAQFKEVADYHNRPVRREVEEAMKDWVKKYHREAVAAQNQATPEES